MTATGGSSSPARTGSPDSSARPRGRLPALLAVVVLVSGCCLPVGPICIGDEEEGTRVREIWAKARHSGFTDLVRFKGHFYCVLREGDDHSPRTLGGGGTIRVIRSRDGVGWHSVAEFEKYSLDLRDPKISVTPDGRLMVSFSGAAWEISDGGRDVVGGRPYVSFSDGTGVDFSRARPVEVDSSIATAKDWLWRVTWHRGDAFGVVYQPESSYALQLVRSSTGREYGRVATLEVPGRPSEAALAFRGDGAAEMVLRRGSEDQRDYLGVSEPPYGAWSWEELSLDLAGPDLLVLEDGTRVVGARTTLGGEKRTVVGVLEDDGRVTNLVELPSGGDTGYPGLVQYREDVWASYYSSHHGKPSIYLARIPRRELGDTVP